MIKYIASVTIVLLNKRAEVVLEIGKLKKENSLEIYDPLSG